MPALISLLCRRSRATSVQRGARVGQPDVQLAYESAELGSGSQAGTKRADTTTLTMPNSDCPKFSVAPRPSRRFDGRKLLVASIGVATVNYLVACSGSGPNLFTTSANLLAPPIIDAAVDNPGDGEPDASPAEASGADAGKDRLDGIGR
jgi:hypothetical protein